ncbi:hypothetical protein, partial [Thiobacillus sp.]|uniref:hypothetical protein n=1 Tax=Thiobacillus sp. TaxID=924 RepID=UPI0025D5E951
SVVTQKYRNMKRRLFPHGGVARRCHRVDYVAHPQGVGRGCKADKSATTTLSLRLALRKNPSVSLRPPISESRH